MTALTWLTQEDATIPKTSAKTADDVVSMQIDKLNNFIAHHFDVGIKTTKNKPQTLIVKRYDKTTRKNREMLKIAIANKTFRLIPIEDVSNKGKIELVRAVINELPNHKEGLYETWKEARPKRGGE